MDNEPHHETPEWEDFTDEGFNNTDEPSRIMYDCDWFDRRLEPVDPSRTKMQRQGTSK